MDKKEILKLCGKNAFRKQIEESGGVYSTKEVSELLGISPSAVRMRLMRGQLLAIPFGGTTVFPVWQFDENGVIEHFLEIKATLSTSSPVGVVQFFLTYDEDLGHTPIEALKSGNPSQLELVKILAKQFNKQVAR